MFVSRTVRNGKIRHNNHEWRVAFKGDEQPRWVFISHFASALDQSAPIWHQSTDGRHPIGTATVLPNAAPSRTPTDHD